MAGRIHQCQMEGYYMSRYNRQRSLRPVALTCKPFTTAKKEQQLNMWALHVLHVLTLGRYILEGSERFKN